MEYQKIITLLEIMKLVHLLNLEQKTGFKQIMLLMEHMKNSQIVQSSLILICLSQVFVIASSCNTIRGKR